MMLTGIHELAADNNAPENCLSCGEKAPCKKNMAKLSYLAVLPPDFRRYFHTTYLATELAALWQMLPVFQDHYHVDNSTLDICQIKAMQYCAHHDYLSVLIWAKQRQHWPLDSTLIEHTITGGSIRCFQWLRDNYDVQSDKGRFMIFAARAGQLAMLQYLVAEGYPIAARTLVEAIGNGHLNILQWVFEAKPVTLACSVYRSNNSEIVPSQEEQKKIRALLLYPQLQGMLLLLRGFPKGYTTIRPEFGDCRMYFELFSLPDNYIGKQFLASDEHNPTGLQFIDALIGIAIKEYQLHIIAWFLDHNLSDVEIVRLFAMKYNCYSNEMEEMLQQYTGQKGTVLQNKRAKIR